MALAHDRGGSGEPLLLMHGIGSQWQVWEPVLPALRAEREVVAIDLPGFGDTPPLAGEQSIAALADATTAFLDAHGLRGVDAVGTSMGARLVLELARRGVVGAVVSLDPGGFWRGWEKRVFGASIALSVRLLRLLEPLLPAITGSAVGRTILLPQFSPKPWALPAGAVLAELRDYVRSPAFDPMLRALARGPDQEGAAATPGPVTIVWGRQDRVCLPRQAARATARFPAARLEWLDDCGHFPHWDQPGRTVALILERTG